VAAKQIQAAQLNYSATAAVNHELLRASALCSACASLSDWLCY
jgi:hypothetical protein